MSTKIINLLSQKVYLVDTVGRVIKKIDNNLKDENIDLSKAKIEVVPFDGITDAPVVQTKISGFDSLPAKKAGVFYLVPDKIKDALSERNDLLKINQHANQFRVVYDGKETIEIDRQKTLAVSSLTV